MSRPTSSMSLPKPGRNIIVLLDGTNNQFGKQNSNLIKTMSVVKADENQLLYYSSGIGTLLPPGASTWGKVRQRVAEVLDLALAWNFSQYVCDAYKYLMDQYRDGDKIYILGFSRGAYTARALAGMIQRVGLLNPGNYNQVQLAYDVYTGPLKVTGEGEGKDPAVLYRRIFGRSRPVQIEFLGVWDTVSSLGGVDLPQLPFASGSKSITFFRQALALDERRARFVPEYWRMDDAEVMLRRKLTLSRQNTPVNGKPTDREQAETRHLETELSKQFPAVATTSKGELLRKHEEVWFMGCHSDVGGGNDANDAPSLSNIPFRWMLREAVRCGMTLDASGVALQTALQLPHANHNTLPDAALHTLQDLRTRLITQSDDACKVVDQWEDVAALSNKLTQADLSVIVETCARADSYPQGDTLSDDAKRPFKESLRGFWWILEILWLQTRDYTSQGVKEQDITRMNKGRPRQMIPGQKLHRSVFNRIAHDARSGGSPTYVRPAARVPAGWPDWPGIANGELQESVMWED